MDSETLFEMASATARNAERNCIPGNAGDSFFGSYGGYPTYINEYNRLLPFVWELGEEAKLLFPPIDLGKQINPADAVGLMWKTYAELAASRLAALAAYLKGRQGARPREHAEIAELIRSNLRAALFADPERERQVQDVLETILRARGLTFRREQESIAYSTKRYIPDFTFDALSFAIEVKLCNRTDREKAMIDEINADIIGYGGRYAKMLFVVYDLGFIRDVDGFRSDIENTPGVSVLVVKK